MDNSTDLDDIKIAITLSLPRSTKVGPDSRLNAFLKSRIRLGQPLVGTTSLRMVLQNPQRYSARQIMVDLSVELLKRTRPHCSRTIFIPYPHWCATGKESNTWNFRFERSADEVYLGKKEMPLGEIVFSFALNRDPKIFEEPIRPFYDMENSNFSQEYILRQRAKFALRHRVETVYHQNPAKDVYKIKGTVRAKDLKPTPFEAKFSVLWANHDIPNLFMSDQEDYFNFHSLPEYPSKRDFLLALLRKIPFGSEGQEVLDFLKRNNIPSYPSLAFERYGVDDGLDPDYVITVNLISHPYYPQIQRIYFCFNNRKELNNLLVDII